MQVSAPHYNHLSLLRKISSFSKNIFWLILFLSVISKILNNNIDLPSLIYSINFLNILAICVFFGLEIISNYILIPKVDEIKMDDLIDNSFGSSFCTINSQGYFDNDELKIGLYKAAANLFEKCFFTYSLVRSTTIKKVIIPFIMLVLIAGLAVIGFKEVPFSLTFLQALLSSSILGSLIKHLILLNRLSAIQDSWIALYQNKDLKENINKYESFVYRYWLQYEKLLSKIYPGIAKKDFNSFQDKLNDEWNNVIKVRYNIK